jgi:hypothetical protein
MDKPIEAVMKQLMRSMVANTRGDGGYPMEKPLEAVMKQLAVKPRQPVNEIVTATGLGKGRSHIRLDLFGISGPKVGGRYSLQPRG